MNKKISKLIERFDATSETGIKVTISVHQDFNIIDPLGESSQELPGIIHLNTSSGIGVNQLNEEQYEILTNTGKFIVTRIK